MSENQADNLNPLEAYKSMVLLLLLIGAELRAVRCRTGIEEAIASVRKDWQVGLEALDMIDMEREVNRPKDDEPPLT